MRKNLINVRKDRCLTQAELSEKLGISIRHYKSLEAGTSYGSVEIWYKLKRLLDAKSIDFLLEQEVNNKPDVNPAKK